MTDRGWFPDGDKDDMPIEVPNPLEEMERLARSRAACQGLVLYVVGALNESLVASGEEPLHKGEMWVKECARELNLAMAGTAVDGVDRKAQLSRLFAKTLKLPREEAPRR